MDFTKLDRYLDAQRLKGIPGLDIVVYHHGAPVHRYLTGTCDHKGLEPVTEDTLYWIYSCTKVMTACAVMQLIEAGKLGLDDAVEEFVPTLGDQIYHNSYGGFSGTDKKITIRHLLSMSSGINYDWHTYELDRLRNLHDDATAAQIVDAIGRGGVLEFEPGTGFQYGLSYDVLGLVIEMVSGDSLSEYFYDHFWKPLGMKDTTFHYERDEVRRRLAAEFKYDIRSHTSEPFPYKDHFRFSKVYESGGEGLVSSVNDYGKFAGALANKGKSKDGYQILSMESIDKMRYTQLPDEMLKDEFSKFDQGYSYGFGVRCMKYPEKCGAKSPVGEFGWDGMAGAYLLADTENEIGIFFAMQVRRCSYAFNVVHPTIRDLTYEAILGK